MSIKYLFIAALCNNVRGLPDDAASLMTGVFDDDAVVEGKRLEGKASREAQPRCRFEPSPGWSWVQRGH